MSELSTYPLRLPHSFRAGVERMSKEDGISINQFVSIAVAEKLAGFRLKPILPSAVPVPTWRHLTN